MIQEYEKKTLLIVDDVELFIQLQISHLGSHRYNIHTASSGNEGLEKARSLKPDLILMDLFMPDMNGDQICRILKNDPDTADIPVVLVSSGVKSVSKSVSTSSQCDGLIYKPVRRDLLLSVVENLLGTNLRIQHRVSVSIQGTANFEEEVYPIHIHTLSNGGAFIEIEETPIRGDLMELTFTLPEHEQEIHVRTAAVVWCGPLNEDGPLGAGVQFLTIDHQASKSITSYVQSRISINNNYINGSATV